MDEDKDMQDGGSLSQQESNKTKSSNASVLDKAKKTKEKKENAEKAIKIIKTIISSKVLLIISAIVIALFLILIILAGSYYFLDLDSKDITISVVNNAVGSQALGKIIEIDNDKYKISYDGKEGTDAIKKLLKENNMNFNDYTKEEMDVLYKALKVEWATTYPKLSDDSDCNKDLKSDYVQGVVTIKRRSQDSEKVLEYKPYEEFTLIKDSRALDYFSMKDGNLIVSNFGSSGVSYNTSGSVPDGSSYQNTANPYSVSETQIDYKSLIGIHAMPFEVSLSLMTNTEDLDFMNDLLDMAIQSEIELTIFDNTTETVTVETTNTQIDTTYEKTIQYQEISYRTDQMGPFPATDKEDSVTSKEKDSTDYSVTTTTTSISNSYVVALTYASSWIADVKNEYTYSTNSETTDGPLDESNSTYTSDPESIADYTADSELKNYAEDNLKNTSKKVRGADGTVLKDASGNDIEDITEYNVTGGSKVTTTDTTVKLTQNQTTVTEKKYVKTDDSPQTSREGEKFKEIYDKNHLAKGNFQNVDTWLFEMLANTESGIDYISVIKFLLYKCTGIDYGVTNIDDILNYYSEQEFTYASNSGGSSTGNWWPIGSNSARENSTGMAVAEEAPALGKEKINRAGDHRQNSKYYGNGGNDHPFHADRLEGAAVEIGANHQKGVYNVISIAKGTVIDCDNTKNEGDTGANWGMGNYVIIEYPAGYRAYYQHLHKGSVKVSPGQVVEQGQVIAKIGNTGNTTGPHLHIDIRINGVVQDTTWYIDPDNPRPTSSGVEYGGLSKEAYDMLASFEGGTQYRNAAGDYIVFNNGIDDNLELTCGVAIGNTGSNPWRKYQDLIGSPGIGDVVSKENYNKIFQIVCDEKNQYIDNALAKYNVTLNKNQREAFFIYIYNMNNGQKNANNAMKAYREGGAEAYYNYTKSVSSSAVQRRRAAEYKLFTTGQYTIN